MKPPQFPQFSECLRVRRVHSPTVPSSPHMVKIKTVGGYATLHAPALCLRQSDLQQ